MNINDLIAIVKNKLQESLIIEQIDIQDKSFLHKTSLRPSRRKVSFKNYDSLYRIKKNEQYRKQ